MKANEFDGDFSEFLNGYDCQPKLTPRLDRLEGIEFAKELVNEMVMWKLNRSVSLDHELLRQLEDLKRLKSGEHRQAKSVLALLLDVSGLDLTMASRVLHFRNPSVLQIIDRHAYRAMYGLVYPFQPSSSAAKKIRVYVDYIDELVNFCAWKKLEFGTVVRVLHQFDKAKNGKLNGR